MLSLTTAPLYDYPEGIDVMEGGQVSAARPGYRQVAAELREKILSGEIPPGASLSSNPVLAAELGDPDRPLSTATVNAAVAQLAVEGLVRVEHGRPTTVVGQRAFRAEVSFPMGDAPAALLAPAVRKAADADPAVSGITTHVGEDGTVTVSALVIAAHGGFAGHRLAELIRSVAGDGWDLAGASVSARPA